MGTSDYLGGFAQGGGVKARVLGNYGTKTEWAGKTAIRAKVQSKSSLSGGQGYISRGEALEI